MRTRVSAAVVVAFLVLATSPAAADDLLAGKIRAAGDTGKYDADAVIVLDETDVTVRPDGIGEATYRRVVKVLRNGGARSEAVQRFSFDPTTNRFEPRWVRVYRADGQVEEVPLANLVVQPEAQWGIFWGSQQALIAVPRLEVGDAVATEYLKTGFNVAYLRESPATATAEDREADRTESAKRAAAGARPAAAAVSGGLPAVIPTPEALEPPMPGHWYDEAAFYSSLPVIEKRYIVRLPRDKTLQFEVYNGELRTSKTIAGQHVVYTFEKRDIPAWKGEANMVASTDVGCKLVLATVEDWPTKSRWFYEKNEPSFVVNDEIRAKVAEVTAGLTDDEAKITALNHWVAENIRYVGTSRGACEGYTTHHVQETFRDRGGVCKDKAGLLVAMLRVAGFDSFIVMTQAGSDVMPIPADQFNHAVTCIRRPDGSFRLLDPTWMPKSRENWSSAEQLQHVVCGVPDGVELMRSPYSGPEENAITWDAKSELTADGGLKGEISVTADGAPDTALRRALARLPEHERLDVIEDGFARLSPRLALTGVRIADPVDFSAPIAVRAAYVADRYALGDAERLFQLPVLRKVLADTTIGDVLGCADLETRKYPARLRSTRRLVFRELLKLPAGWKLAALPPAKEIDGPAAAFRFGIERSQDGMLTYECTVDFKKHRVPADEYANLREVVTALKDLSDRRLICTVEAERAQR